jgi:hypothetical protein
MADSHTEHPMKQPLREPRATGILPYPFPPPSLVVAEAKDDELSYYGLPSREAAGFSPTATAFRRAFLLPPPGGRPLSFLRVLETAMNTQPPGIRPIAAIASWPIQKSINWSGGYVVASDGRSFKSVMGCWTVPAVSLPPGGTAQEYHSSTWIGLDGQRLYLDSSLPQIGTRQRWLTTPYAGADYTAWFQWWARGQDNPPEDLPLPVDAGHKISAIITVLDEFTVRFNLKNETLGIILQAFNASAPPPCRISGATAEWIMERPSPLGSDGWDAYALPAYTPFAFTGCVAESTAPYSNALREHDLESASLIRMYEIIATPPGTRTISTAKRVLESVQRLELTRLIA